MLGLGFTRGTTSGAKEAPDRPLNSVLYQSTVGRSIHVLGLNGNEGTGSVWCVFSIATSVCSPSGAFLLCYEAEAYGYGA